MKITDVFTAMSSVYDSVLSMFASIVSTITGNPLLYTPVLLALVGGLVLFAIRVVKKLGVHGISSAGRRRRARR